MEVQLHSFFNKALDRAEWSASSSGLFTPKERTFDYKTGWSQDWSRLFAEQMKIFNFAGI
jgi:hypothetical protein